MTETEAKWTERIREWKASGKSYDEFAEGQGFKGLTIRYWACIPRWGAPSERREEDVCWSRVDRFEMGIRSAFRHRERAAGALAT